MFLDGWRWNEQAKYTYTNLRQPVIYLLPFYMTVPLRARNRKVPNILNYAHTLTSTLRLIEPFFKFQ